ncbi:MAG: glycosyltransferase [Bacteroidia bacterium]|jgi:glycosyltransferase involved in cell wall biosynthesis|nr:glycosyltransferase [Bacteroidia bacterium]
MRSSLQIPERPYQTKRFKLGFETGPLFYAFYNIRLFFFLLFSKADILVTNDLDTLLPNFIISRLKKSVLFYDSHEYFTEVPELVARPHIRNFWLSIEKFVFPKLKNVFTVNESIASIYTEKYKVPVSVVRNLPFRSVSKFSSVTRDGLGLPIDKKIFLFQGAGINIDRGAEEAIEAIAKTENAALLFIGGGDVLSQLKEKVKAMKIAEKVFFLPKQPMEILYQYTSLADFGLTLDKDTNLNYRFSLPNKLFDYIQAGLPVLASDLPEVRKIIDQYKIGKIAPSTSVTDIAATMKQMISDDHQFVLWKENLKIAASELCWENEEKKLLQIFKDVI